MIRRDFIKTGMTAALLATTVGQALASTAKLKRITPFHINVPQSTLDRIHKRVADAQISSPLGTNGWEQGVDASYMSGLREHWLQGYNWRNAERALNRHPQFTAQVDNLVLDFYHVPGKVPAGSPPAKPVMIIHGWPYSRFSLVDVIDRLTDPARFGGDPRTALTVVAPSLPGHGFASKPIVALTPTQIAAHYQQLMTQVLGYEKFGLQGGDHGHVLATYLAHDFPDNVTGLHLNMVPTPPVPLSEQPPDVAAWTTEKDAFIAKAFAYFWLQSGKPAALAYGLADSPIGLAAWFTDKFHAWADLDSTAGDLNKALGDEKDAKLGLNRVLTEVMVYLVSDSVASSIWFYQAFRQPGGSPFFPGGRITAPTAAYLPDREFVNGRPPRAFAERFFNIVRWTEVRQGAHFPFWETPETFASDITAFFKTTS